ncbi:hypothetical protein [Nocardia iowensis]|uniref:HEAT repeat domain-containing protein n=1 Tax=Nocardia iowensis TaxID=204891 RepID=A0ABX8RZW5_NOCIO|nr:hypothetical protein [Nocardia iowensis]QXN94382.1 hypothetical protein KV110_15770 [Nocardia iowensis]
MAVESIGADVEAALEVLGDGTPGAEWAWAETVLRQAGPAAWPGLAEAVVYGDDESAQRAGVLLGFAHVTDEIRIRVSYLLDEDPRERRESVSVLGWRGSAMAPFARVLATRLDDPEPSVVAEAVGAFAGIGRVTVPVLREVRRSRLSSRRAALAALAEIGWDTIDPWDMRVLTRLTTAKSRTEIPQPFYPDAEWYALRTTDRDAVLRAFDLSDPVPVTMRAGFERWSARRTTPPGPWLLERSADHRQCGQMFVSPVLDGWTLVFGKPKDMYHDDTAEEDYEHDAQQRLCVDLSRQFGTVYWYVQIVNGGCGDWMGWCAAENGTLTRYYHHDFSEGAVDIGDPLTAEAGLRDPDGAGLLGMMNSHLPREKMLSLLGTQPDYDDRDLDDTAYAAAQQIWSGRVQAALADVGVDVLPTRSAALIAKRTTVGLDELGPGTSVAGHGVLALTECGRQWGHRGAFPL